NPAAPIARDINQAMAAANNGDGRGAGEAAAGAAIGIATLAAGELAAEEKGLGLGAPAARGAGRLLFGQGNGDVRFANGEFAGMTIGEVAARLRSGAISTDQLPIEFIRQGENMVTLNNRSLTALRRAGMEPSILIDRTGIPAFEEQLVQQLRGSVP